MWAPGMVGPVPQGLPVSRGPVPGWGTMPLYPQQYVQQPRQNQSSWFF
jgi:hypothetical protein